MSSASLVLTRALVAALKADAVLGARGGVYDAPPPGAGPPYLTVGPDLVSDWSTKSGPGREHRLRVTAYEPPLASGQCGVTLALVEAVVVALPAVLDGHLLIACGFVRSSVAAETPGGPTKGVIEFRARTQAVAAQPVQVVKQ